MHKNLHKDLYSKRNKKKKYLPVNKITIFPSDKEDIEIEESVGVVNKKKYNRLALLTTIIASGLIIFGYSFFNSNSQSEINLISVEQNETISEDFNATTSSTSTTSTTTTSTSSTSTTTTSTTTTTVPVIVQNITDAQNQLTILGLYTGEINNELNNETKAALKEFQRLAGLTVDGILGPNTKAALEKGEDSYIDIGGADVNNVEIIIYSKEIENAQKTLKELSLYTGEIDGINGKSTKFAIKEFQKLAGLTIDGVLGPNTKAALEKGEDSYVSVNTI